MERHKLLTNDSDASGETNSLSTESTPENVPELVPKRKVTRRRDSEWEVVEGLKEGQRFEKKPDLFTGYLHKKRKWPLKGWHKRFFILDKGILVYGKNAFGVDKGKIHGSVDVGLSVISSKVNGHRIDIDTEEFIYHLKTKAEDGFVRWLQQLKEHRLYRQHELSYGSKFELVSPSRRGEGVAENLESLDVIDAPCSPVEVSDRLLNLLRNSRSTYTQIEDEIKLTERNLLQLGNLLGQCDSLKHNERVRINHVENNSSFSLQTNLNLSTGHLTLTSTEVFNHEAYTNFFLLAEEVFSNLKSIASLLCSERDTFNNVFSEENKALTSITTKFDLIHGLQDSLKIALHQNDELRRRMKCVHDNSACSNMPHLDSRKMKKHSNDSPNCDSSGVSASEFFDAEDMGEEDQEKTDVPSIDLEAQLSTRVSDTSSEAETISSSDSLSSGSELAAEYPNSASHVIMEGKFRVRKQKLSGKSDFQGHQSLTGRRTTLPVCRPVTEGLSLWNLLYKNIGKDLSQISMPVGLNEPLNILQRLCEELEYSELLDKAAELVDPFERMVYVAAFAVSGYASSYSRAGNKPFNPLLGETYECIREDKGFRFLAEQVSHHPPISACHAESRNFIFWQEARVKTKFWGKSMEFQPLGKVRLLLPQTGDTYSWNKVTTCVHNLFSGQRWVDQYGELHITNKNVSCKLTFAKTTYWSSKRHEVFGTVYDSNGKSVRKLFGNWSEALYCGVAPSARCIWRAGTLPTNQEQYYGFTRFAIELNELGRDFQLLPATDTRLRPDQRALENGNLTKAEQLKSQVEQAQRERRKARAERNVVYEPQWFYYRPNSKDEDEWQYNGKYWDVRKNSGFSNMQLESLW